MGNVKYSDQETAVILTDKQLMANIKAAEAEYKRGKYLTFEQVFCMTPAEALEIVDK